VSHRSGSLDTGLHTGSFDENRDAGHHSTLYMILS
jgi:hypothetical protein